MIDTQFDFAIGIPPYNGGTRQLQSDFLLSVRHALAKLHGLAELPV